MGSDLYNNWFSQGNPKVNPQGSYQYPYNIPSNKYDYRDVPNDTFSETWDLPSKRPQDFNDLTGMMDDYIYNELSSEGFPFSEVQNSYNNYNDIFNTGSRSIPLELPPQNEFPNIKAGALEGKLVAADPEYALTADIHYTNQDKTSPLGVGLYGAAAYSIESIQKYDWDKDGNISAHEFGLDQTTNKDDIALFKAIDVNQDKKISQEEHLAYVIAEDLNHDGVVTLEERNGPLYVKNISDNFNIIKQSGIIGPVLNLLNKIKGKGQQYPRRTLTDKSPWAPYTNPYYRQRQRTKYDTNFRNFPYRPGPDDPLNDHIKFFAKRFGIQFKDLAGFFKEKFPPRRSREY